MKRIYHFAKFGDFAQKPYGGGEIGNRRTKKILEELGYDVKPINRYYNYKKKNIFVIIDMILGDFFSLIHFSMILLVSSRKDCVVHISGFTGIYMSYEFMSVLLARILGYKVIYEIRGGGIINNYESGSSFYKIVFKNTIKLANHIWSQGKENERIIKEFSKSSFFHYPNCVNSEFMPKTCPIRKNKPICLLYLGRISPSKNVLTIVQTSKYLKDKGEDVKLYIIGGASDYPDYLDMIKKYIRENKLQNNCTLLGQLDKSEMKDYLNEAMFFLFPSQEKREGQSNALTEAMSFGIVPVASSQGYNRFTINNDFLIVDNLTPEAYGNKVIDVFKSGYYDILSKEMHSRIKQYFTYDSIKNNIRTEYNKITNSL